MKRSWRFIQEKLMYSSAPTLLQVRQRVWLWVVGKLCLVLVLLFLLVQFSHQRDPWKSSSNFMGEPAEKNFPSSPTQEEQITSLVAQKNFQAALELVPTSSLEKRARLKQQAREYYLEQMAKLIAESKWSLALETLQKSKMFWQEEHLASFQNKMEELRRSAYLDLVEKAEKLQQDKNWKEAIALHQQAKEFLEGGKEGHTKVEEVRRKAFLDYRQQGAKEQQQQHYQQALEMYSKALKFGQTPQLLQQIAVCKINLYLQGEIETKKIENGTFFTSIKIQNTGESKLEDIRILLAFPKEVTVEKLQDFSWLKRSPGQILQSRFAEIPPGGFHYKHCILKVQEQQQSLRIKGKIAKHDKVFYHEVKLVKKDGSPQK